MRFPRRVQGVGAPRSLRTQVTVSAALVVMVIVALAGLLIAVRIHDQDLSQVDSDLSARALKVKSDAGRVLTDDRSRDHDGAAADDDVGLLAGSQSLVRVISGDEVVSQHGEIPTGVIPLPGESGFDTVRIGAQDWRSLVEPLAGGGELQVLESLAPVQQRWHDNGQLIVVVVFAATLITALGVWLVTGLVLAPLQRLRSGAGAIRSGHDLALRLPLVRRPHEIAELSATLNGMLEGLQTSMLSTRRFTADAGHELRTPLTSLGIDLETLRRNPKLTPEQRSEMLAAMTVEHSRIVGLLDGLQTLARGDAGALPAHADVDLPELLDEAVERARRHHPVINYRIHDQIGDLALVDGWRDGLQIAIDNLLDNAARHGKPAGRIDVRLFAIADDRVGIAIADDGPGIPASLGEEMKQRFTRGPQTRSEGSGLGLALVEQQVTLHGGTLSLGQSNLGGLEATITLPARFVATEAD
jgi:two-component system sensor histidine kinase PrrB